MAAVTAAAVAGLALLAQLALLDRSAVPVDEGQLVAIAGRILHGDVLYRDVYTGIFPGIYYATAGLFALFGEDVLVTRWAQALVNAATAACLFGVAHRCVRRAWSLLPPLLYVGLVALGFPGLSMFNYSPFSLVFGLGALWCLLRYLAGARSGDAVACGLLLGACGLVKQNFGALAVAGVGLGLVLGRAGGPLASRSLARAAWPILASGGLVAVAGGLALAGAGAFDAFVHQTLLVIGESQLEAFDDPIPPIFGAHPTEDPRFVFVYTPAALFNYLVRGESLFGVAVSPGLSGAAIRLAYGATVTTLGLGALWLAFARGGPPAPRAARRAVVAFALALFPGIFPSAIWSHLAFVLPPVLLVVALLGDRVDAALGSLARPALPAWRGLHVALALACLALTLRISLDVRGWYPEPLGLPRGSLHVSADQRALLRGATRFLTRCAREDEPVFVAPDMPLVYFLADRRNPTPYDLVIPGAIDEALIVERLRTGPTRCVVYNPRMYLQFPPFGELFPVLAEHLAGTYRGAVSIPGAGGGWQGLVLRDESAR